MTARPGCRRSTAGSRWTRRSPRCSARAARSRARTSSRLRSRCRATRARRARNANRVELSRRGPGVVVDDEPLRAARAVRVARPVRAVHRRARSSWTRADGGARAARDRRRRRRSSRSAWRSSSCSARSTRTTSTSTSCGSGGPSAQSSGAPMSDRDIAVLGVGDAPVGQVGPQLRRVRRRRRAGRARRRGRRVERHPVRRRAATPCATATPGTSPGATFAQALGWNGAQVASSYAACASGVTALVGRARADPRRVLRRRARRRRRHDTQGLPRAEQGRAGRRPRLVAVPAARRDEPHLLRPVRAPAHGDVRRDARGLRAGEGEERPPRPAQPERAVPQGGDDRRRAGVADRRPTRCGLLDICATSDGAAAIVVCEHGVRARTARRRRRRAGHRDLDGHARATRTRSSRCPNFATDSRGRRPARASRARLQGVDRGARVRGGRPRPRRPRLRRGVRPLDRARARLVRADRAVPRRARPRSWCATARRRSAAASR